MSPAPSPPARPHYPHDRYPLPPPDPPPPPDPLPQGEDKEDKEESTTLPAGKGLPTAVALSTASCFCFWEVKQNLPVHAEDQITRGFTNIAKLVSQRDIKHGGEGGEVPQWFLRSDQFLHLSVKVCWGFVIGQCHGNGVLFDVGVDATWKDGFSRPSIGCRVIFDACPSKYWRQRKKICLRENPCPNVVPKFPSSFVPLLSSFSSTTNILPKNSQGRIPLCTYLSDTGKGVQILPESKWRSLCVQNGDKASQKK